MKFAMLSLLLSCSSALFIGCASSTDCGPGECRNLCTETITVEACETQTCEKVTVIETCTPEIIWHHDREVKRESETRKIPKPAVCEVRVFESPVQIMNCLNVALVRGNVETVRDRFTPACWDKCGVELQRECNACAASNKHAYIKFDARDFEVQGDTCHAKYQLCLKDNMGREEVQERTTTLIKSEDGTWKFNE